MSENVDQLKQLIAGTLEHRGVLSKIRAELRHHVFLALDEQESAAHQAQTPNNTNGNSSHSTTTPKGGHIATKKKKIAELHGNPLAVDLLELVKDFCDCYELEYTNALLNTEAEGTGHKVNRKLLADKYHLSPSSTLSNQPLLLELLQRHSGVSTVSDSSVSPREEVGIGSRRSLYREKSNHDDENDGRQEREREKEQRERQQERERQQAKERAVRQQQEAEQKSKQLSEAELSPRNPPPALAPLKKPSSLGSLAPLAPLGGAKPSLAPLSAPKGLSVQPSLNDKKISPVPSPSNASTTSSGNVTPTSSSSTNPAANTFPSSSSSHKSPPPSFVPSSSSTTSKSTVGDELDLDALEAEVFGTKTEETFLPGGDNNNDSHVEEEYEIDEDVENNSYESSTGGGSSHSNNITPKSTYPPPSSKPSTTSSTLASLSSAPSLTGKSSSSSLAPLAPIGRTRPNFSAAPSSYSSSNDHDSSHDDSLHEEDARTVAALDSKIAKLQQQQQQQQQHQNTFSSKPNVERSEDYDDSFVGGDQVEEDLDIEVEEEYSEEEF